MEDLFNDTPSSPNRSLCRRVHGKEETKPSDTAASETAVAHVETSENMATVDGRAGEEG